MKELFMLTQIIIVLSDHICLTFTLASDTKLSHPTSKPSLKYLDSSKGQQLQRCPYKVLKELQFHILKTESAFPEMLSCSLGRCSEIMVISNHSAPITHTEKINSSHSKSLLLF